MSPKNITTLLRSVLCTVIVCATTLCLPTVAHAIQNKSSKNIGIVTQPLAIVKAKEFAGGRVLRVDNTPTGFRVKLLQKSGRVISLDINRTTGEVTQFHSSEQKKGK